MICPNCLYEVTAPTYEECADKFEEHYEECFDGETDD